MIFEELKKGFRSSLKEHTIDLNAANPIKNLMLITDNYDNVDERVETVEKINSLFESKLIKIYLYDLTHHLSHEKLEKSWIIETLEAHSSNIRSLKGKGFTIILEPTVRSFLLDLRSARSSTPIETEGLGNEEIEALADFFLKAPIRQQNFISSILENILSSNPELIYWRPPFLKERTFQEIQSSIQNFSLKLIKEIPSNIWTFLEGNKKLDDVQSVTGLLFGGQGEYELYDIIFSINSIFSKLPKPKLSLLVHIDGYEFNLAKMIAQNTAEKLGLEYEKDSSEGNISLLSDEQIQTLVTEKYKSMIENLRVERDAIDYRVSFDDLSGLESSFRITKPDCLVLPIRKDGEQQFLDRVITKANLALNQGISVLIV